jgi:hypothetical protein
LLSSKSTPLDWLALPSELRIKRRISIADTIPLGASASALWLQGVTVVS